MYTLYLFVGILLFFICAAGALGILIGIVILALKTSSRVRQTSAPNAGPNSWTCNPHQQTPSPLHAPAFGGLFSSSSATLAHTPSVLNQLRSVDPFTFESIVCDLYRRKGHAVQDGKLRKDHGIDGVILAGGQKWLLQCKRYGETSVVGESVVREAYGAMHKLGAHRAIVVTTGRFSQSAIDWAVGMPIDLIDGPTLVDDLARVAQVSSKGDNGSTQWTLPSETSGPSMSLDTTPPTISGEFVQKVQLEVPRLITPTFRLRAVLAALCGILLAVQLARALAVYSLNVAGSNTEITQLSQTAPHESSLRVPEPVTWSPDPGPKDMSDVGGAVHCPTGTCVTIGVAGSPERTTIWATPPPSLPGKQRPIWFKHVDSGTEATLLGIESGMAHVRLANGDEGWVESTAIGNLDEGRRASPPR